MNIETRIESARGCGYRQPGGLYFVSGKAAAVCDRLPVPLDPCPCCGHQYTFQRGHQWLRREILELSPCPKKSCRTGCGPFRTLLEQFLLMWVGQKYYTCAEFSQEAANRGVSKRLSQVPKDFQVGRDWVALAHMKAIDNTSPGIFYLFSPTAIEYVVRPNDSEEHLQQLQEQGITLVRVVRDVDAQLPIT
jgi:hypothetical protein